VALETVGALIAAAASLGVAVFSVVTAGKARRLVARVEEDAKQSEQVRIHATEAGVEILKISADLIIAAETVHFFLLRRAKKVLEESETRELFKPMTEPVHRMRQIMYSTEIYTTEEIRSDVSNLLQSFIAGNVSFEDWDEYVEKLRKQHSKIATSFRKTYLSNALGGFIAL